MRPLRGLAAILGLLAATGVPSHALPPPTFPGVRSVLWIGAHPDDELLAAPLLGRLCVDEALSCTFLVLTRGEAGTCRLPHGCHPDLGTVRSQELQRSVRIFRASLHHWNLPDGGVGGADHGALVERLSNLLAAVRPDLVLTFDPRHGSTCHPDHRATGDAALQAIERDPQEPAAVLLETLLLGPREPFAPRFEAAAPATAGAIGFDANPRLGSTRLPAWDFLLRAAQSHASQFEPSALRGLRKVPPRHRVVYFAPAAMALASDAVAGCN